MLKWTYLFFNLLVLLPPLLISLFSDVKTYKNWKALGAAILAVSVPFIIWDVWAAANEHWFFSTTYVLSPRLYDLPFEEILFFVTIPFAMCFVWDSLQKHISSRAISEVLAGLGLSLIALSAFVILLTQWGRGYTRSAAIATLIAVLVIVLSGWWRRNIFWWFQAILFMLFFVFNTFLTALPVITYGIGSAIGFRVGTIPLEDFFFNFALVSLFVLTYDYVRRKLSV